MTHPYGGILRIIMRIVLDVFLLGEPWQNVGPDGKEGRIHVVEVVDEMVKHRDLESLISLHC